MNVCVRNTFVSLWLFFGAVSLSAQGASFYFPFLNNAVPTTNKLMPLKVVNLDSVVAVQMVIRWDPTVLKFVNIDSYGLGDLNSGDFNTSHALDSGFVRMQWEGDVTSTPGTTVADSSTIFRLRFNVIGECNDSSLVRVTEILDFPPLNFEVVKVLPSNNNVAYGLDDCPRTDGFVAVCYTVANQEIEANDIPLSIAPNPFSVDSKIEFSLEETADTQVFITNMQGQKVFEKNFFQLSPGQHGMVIENTMLGAPGVYALSIQAGRKTATRSFVLF